jgi:hypothetical protein
MDIFKNPPIFRWGTALQKIMTEHEPEHCSELMWHFVVINERRITCSLCEWN